MTNRNIRKNLAGMQDLLQGIGDESQTRGETSTTVSRIDTPFAVDTVAKMQALDITVYTRARVYTTNIDFIEYIYDATATVGVAPTVGGGQWVAVNATSINTAITSALYDFDIHGGVIGEIAIGSIPDNATVIRGWYEVLIAPTSGGAGSVAFGIEVDDLTGLQIASSVGGANMILGYHDFVTDGTAANFTTKTTAERDVHIRITTADLTAGKIRCWYEYVWSQ